MEDTEFEGMVKGKLKGLYIYRLPWWRRLSVYNAGDLGSIPGLGRSPGEGNGTPLQYSCLESPMDGGAWWATVHGVVESDMTW